MARVCVIATGACNTSSILAGIRKAGGSPFLLERTEDVLTSSHVVVPGVGTLHAAMHRIRLTPGLEDALKSRVKEERPTLFVCVGMQLLCLSSDESPGSSGLGVLPIHVTSFPPGTLKPQQGWNTVDVSTTLSPSPNPSVLASGEAYFSNSFILQAAPLGWAAATTLHGVPFVSAIEKGGVVATQFHPELSGDFGIALIRRWINTPDVTPQRNDQSGPHADPFLASNLTRRIIPCLDVKNGRVVKGIKFQNLTDAGDPAEQARAYAEQGADEITILDVSATPEGRDTAVETVRRVREVVSIPLTVGGGVNSIESAQRLLAAGADKVSVNTAAVRTPQLLNELSAHFGAQCTVLAIDAKRKDERKWKVVVRSGTEETELDAIEWAKEGVNRGAGEILLTSMDRDGTKSGYDLELLKAVAESVTVPVVASGGASSPAHMAEALREGRAAASLAASIFHYAEYTVGSVKEHLRKDGLAVRSVDSRGESEGHGKREGSEKKAESAVEVEEKVKVSGRERPLQCFVPSCDIMNGRCVQLVGGKRERLEVDAGDPVAIVKNLGVCGEVAVVDLDAAMGAGENRDIIRSLLPLAKCRVGGGIRTVSSAIDWLNAGAAKVVIGTAASAEFLSQLPCDRVVVALDAVHGEVVVEGWTSPTGQRVENRIRELAPYADNFLVTFVEREGRMGGVDEAGVTALADIARECGVTLTIAGGITTEKDIITLDRLGCEAQVGMALYTGKISLGRALCAPLHSDRPDGLFPTVVCDESRRVLGLAYSSKDTLEEAVASRKGIYHSRQRGRWVKGETSGHTQELLEVALDCDRDSVLFVVKQGGGFCHRPNLRSCFGHDVGLAKLLATIAERRVSAPAGSYTKRLFEEAGLLEAKLREEAHELAEAVTQDDVAWEAADVIYFVFTKLSSSSVSLSQVEKILDLRSLKVTRRKGDAKPQFLTPSAASAASAASPYPSAEDSKENAENTPKALNGKVENAKEKSAEGNERERERGDEEAFVFPRKTLADLTAVRKNPCDAKALEVAKSILDDIRSDGEAAVLRYATKFGDVEEGGKPYYFKDDLEKAFLSISSDVQGILRRVADRIRSFAIAQKSCFASLATPIAGGEAGHTLCPVDVAGCYAPAGRYPLPSTVLMTVITARVAGCRCVWAASPHPSPLILAAAHIAGADGLLGVGGTQAIGAFALGCGPLPPCDAIVGPGNRFVTAAKSLLSGTVRIDGLAGPSECLVVADETSNPAFIAADLIAQAEHDSDASAVLVSLSEAMIQRVEEEITRQLSDLPTAATARQALSKNSFTVVTPDLTEAAHVCDAVAPEHLELHLRNPSSFVRSLSHFGCVFIGSLSAEVFGDYGAGPNHTLPTGGSARVFGGLSVLSFLRCRTWLRIDSATAAREMMVDAVALGEMEGLSGHARAAAIRLSAPPPSHKKPTPAPLSSLSPSPSLGPSLPKRVPLFSLEGEEEALRLALPKGHTMAGVLSLLKDAGVSVTIRERNLRPSISLPNFDVKLLNPRNVVEMLHHGTRDIGFAGVDLIQELQAKVEPYFNLGLDPVKLVIAAPESSLDETHTKLRTDRHLLIASEYEFVARKYVQERGLNATVLKTFGSTEVFPPEDADAILDNSATGTTLRANNLVVLETVMTSSTYLCVHPGLLKNPIKRARVDHLVSLLRSAMHGRERVLLDLNVSQDNLEAVLQCLPSLQAPTVSPLAGGGALAVRSAVPKKDANDIAMRVRKAGGSSILVTPAQQLFD